MQQATRTAPAPQAARPKAPVPPPEFREDSIAAMDAAALLSILNSPSSSEFQKAKACQRLGELGAKEAIPALAALLDDEHLSVYARYGLEPMADPAADEALRAALNKLKGDRLIGVVNSISKRRDSKAEPALSRMLHSPDPNLARAAAAALGNIGGVTAAKQLQAAMAKTSGPLKMAVADASLVCAERLLADGKRDQAMAVYASLSGPDVPKAARLAAMSGIIREETSMARPR